MEKIEERNFVIRSNNTCVKEPCCVCEGFAEADIPYWIFLNGTYNFLCVRCAEEITPHLLEMVSEYNSKWWKKNK